MRKFKLATVLFFACHILGAQVNYDWWNNIHNWDGYKSWILYIQNVPGIMGPNALPVPELQNGLMDTNITMLTAAETHVAPGDFTANLLTELNFPIKKAVALRVWWVPVEYFKTDTIIRDKRAARTREAKGFALGDVYIGMLIPLVQHKTNWPDLLLNITLKTASGSRYEDARFVDAPGYAFDISAGKNFTWQAVFPGANLRWYGSLGFLVYQTHYETYFQNDCLSYGAGVDLWKGNHTLRLQVAGYSGYLEGPDSPTVGRAEYQYKIKKTALILRLQTGNDSFPFTSVRAGCQFTL
jgi:hypothetical protein